MTHTRKKGLLAAGAFGTAFALLIGFFVVRGSSNNTTSNDIDAGLESSLPTEILGTARPRTGGFAEPGRGLASAKGLTIQIADKQDPSRLAAEIRSKSVDPQPGGRQIVEEPQAWVFLKDGRILYIRSDRGNFFIPEGEQRPEHGTFRGNAQAKLFKPDEAGNPVDLERDTPALIAWSEGFAFDLTLGQLTTEDRVRITSPDIDAAFIGLTVLIDEVNERITLAEIARGEYVRYSPPPKVESDTVENEKQDSQPTRIAQNTQPKPAPDKQATNAPPKKNQEAASPAIESLYHAIFSENVVLDQNGAQIKADRMDIWARLINNELPENAIGGMRQADQPRQSSRVQRSIETPLGLYARLMSLMIAASDTELILTRSSDQDVTLRWSGPLVLRPLDRTPNELNDDHVALRFTTEHGLVRFTDAQTGASGHCSTLTYGATRPEAILSGPGHKSAAVDSPEHGSATAARIEVDLSSGLIHIPSPYALTGPSHGDDKPLARITGTGQADFILTMTLDGAIDGLKEAFFTGDVVLEQDKDTITGQVVRAEFEKKEDGTPSLSRLIVDGQVVAKSNRGEELVADHLDVTFEPGADDEDPIPTYMIADGNIRGTQNGTTLNSDHLEASLAQIEKTTISDTGQEQVHTRLVVTEAIATGDVMFHRNFDNITASADTLKAWPEQQIVELFGEYAHVSRAGTSLAGRQIRLDGIARRGLVFGRGDFAHTTGAADQVDVSWSREMTFDDITGVVECFGEVAASSRTLEEDGRLRRDEIAAHHVQIQLSPLETQDTANGLGLVASESEDRSVLSMHAFGSILEEENGKNARIESRLYAANLGDAQAQDQLEQLFYVDGPEIIAHNESGTLDIPGAGQLLLGDLRSGSEEPRENGPIVDPKDTARARFQWNGSLALDRPAGMMTMRRDVQMRHLTKDDKLTDMVCDELIARIAEPDVANQADSQSLNAQIESVSAIGAVYFEWGPSGKSATKRLMADRIDYNAAGIAEAFANKGNVVTLFDDDRATAITAAHLYIDTVNDRIEIKDPGPVISPR